VIYFDILLLALNRLQLLHFNCVGQMRSLRIFYRDDACTSGQLVIASRESQYKILHFHHGGLDRLVETLAEWKFLAQPKRRVFFFFIGILVSV